MSSEELQVFLHIAAVIVGLGVTFVYPFLQAWAERQGVAATRYALQFALYLEKYVVIPGATLVALFGVGLIFEEKYHKDMPTWLEASIAWYVVAYLAAIFVQRPNTKRTLATLEGVADSATLPDAYRRAAMRMQIVGGLLGLSVLGIAFLMVARP